MRTVMDVLFTVWGMTCFVVLVVLMVLDGVGLTPRSAPVWVYLLLVPIIGSMTLVMIRGSGD